MAGQDYYQILGVPKTASDADLKKAYRRLAKKYHPDVSTEVDAGDKFKQLQEAYEVLKDPEKRKLYDRYGEHWQQAAQGGDHKGQSRGDGQYHHHGGSQNFEGFENIFADLFGQRQNGSQQQSFKMKGQDLTTEVKISIVDALNGAERELHFSYQHINEHGQPEIKNKRLKVKIPKGIGNHKQIRLKGQGGAGYGGGENGDLYIEVAIESSKQFKVVGDDIYSHIPIAPWEAALGAEIQIALPQGKAKLKIPAHTQSGKQMRMKGKGFVGGDFYVVLNVILPPAVTEKQKAFYENMAKEMAFDPRKDLLGA
ncbi:MAG: DnaJ C-terminal domain-containing protein [Francisellaceae bacterium]